LEGAGGVTVAPDKIVCGFKARLYPTAEQADRLNQWAGSLRFLWNRLLEAEQAEYAISKKFLPKKELQRLAVKMKATTGTEWIANLPAHAVLDCVARLDGALWTCFKQRKKGKRWGFPKPKKKFVRESGIYCVGQATAFADRCVRVPKMGAIKMRGGKLPEGRLLAARIWRDGSRWMISGQFECARPEPLPASNVMLGIDLGVSTLVTAFDGEGFPIEQPAPRKLRKSLRRLRRAQRRLSARKKGSARRKAQRLRVNAIHRRVREQRNDILHQISHLLTAKAGVIKFETLNVKGMMRSNLAVSVADAGMSRLVTFCEYKADWRGRRIEKIDSWFPSTQACFKCGCINSDMKNLSRRVFICAECGHTEGRDRNASRNVYWYGEERRNRSGDAPTCGEIGEQGMPIGMFPVPVVEPRILARGWATGRD
jgi:putative transposase